MYFFPKNLSRKGQFIYSIPILSDTDNVLKMDFLENEIPQTNVMYVSLPRQITKNLAVFEWIKTSHRLWISAFTNKSIFKTLSKYLSIYTYSSSHEF